MMGKIGVKEKNQKTTMKDEGWTAGWEEERAKASRGRDREMK